MTASGPYRRLLLLLPARLRERYGAEMEALFLETLASRRSSVGRARIWVRGAIDIVTQAMRSRLGASARRSPTPESRGPSRPKSRQTSTLESTMQDLRYALRALIKSPGYTAVAVATLAVGIGANSSIFSLVNAVLLRPPAHVERPDELIAIFTSDYSGPRYSNSSYPDFLDFRARIPALADALYFRPSTVNLASAEGAARIFFAESVSGNYFDLLGVEPILGRTFTAEEADPESGAAAAVISYGFWSRELGRDPGAIGTTLRLSGQTVTLVGVAPPGFGGSVPVVAPDFWLPPSTQALIDGVERFDRRGNRGLFLRARLAPGATASEAQAQLDVLASQLHAAYPSLWTDVNDEVRKITVSPDARLPFPEMRGTAMGFSALLLAVVATVLLIACANLANLTLARASRRRHEVAIRLALGSGRGRLVRQFLGESCVVGLLGGLGGAALAIVAMRFAAAFRPPGGIEIGLDLSLDLRVYLFTTVLTLLTVLAVGLLPALRASRPDLVPALKDGAQTAPARFRWLELRHALVVAQITASLVLLVGAGLFLKSLGAAARIDPGFDPSAVATAGFNLEPEGYDGTRAVEFARALRERVAAIPDVSAAAVSDRIPLAFGSGQRRGISVPGYLPQTGEDMEFEFLTVAPGFLHTLRMPLLRGREFTEADSAEAPQVVMVNRTFAESFWPGEDALGKRIIWAGEKEAEVVGVVADARYRQLDEETRLAFFVPLAQSPQTRLVLSARTTGSPSALLAAIRSEVRALDGTLPLTTLRTYEEAMAGSLLPQRVGSWILTVAGGLGLLLAAVGLYAVMAYLVAQRTRELGVRLALGARARDVILMVLGRGLVLAAIGAGLGIALAAALSRFVTGFLFGVSPLDPIVFVIMAIATLTVAAVATFLPARRAARIHPAITLREE